MRSKRLICLVLAAVATPFLVGGLACRHFRIWSYQDYVLYGTLRDDYPIGLDLWYGRIAAGQDVEDVIAKAPPHRTLRFGRFIELDYFPGGPPPPGAIPFEGLRVIAKDGKLVCAAAGSCCWGRVFFDMSAQERAEYEKSIQTYLDECLGKQP